MIPAQRGHQQKRLQFDVGNSRDIAHQILRNSRNQIDQKHDGQCLSAVQLLHVIPDLLFPEDDMHGVHSQEMSQPVRNQTADNRTDNGNTVSADYPVHITGSQLNRLSRENADDNLYGLEHNQHQKRNQGMTRQPIRKLRPEIGAQQRIPIEQNQNQRYPD